MARGYMYGESRVIVGAHYTSEAFLEQMKKARAEFAAKKGAVGMSPVEPATPANGQAYRVNGMPAIDETRVIVIQGNQKHLRK